MQHLDEPMTRTLPFSIPQDLPPDLARVLAYWRGLLRGEAEMPFADDLNLAHLPDLTPRLFLIDVFERPMRFRVGKAGAGLGLGDAEGRFLDEARFAEPFAFLPSQCAAAVEAAAPTYFADQGGRASSRLVLPLWGEGRVSTLLGAVDFG